MSRIGWRRVLQWLLVILLAWWLFGLLARWWAGRGPVQQVQANSQQLDDAEVAALAIWLRERFGREVGVEVSSVQKLRR